MTLFELLFSELKMLYIHQRLSPLTVNSLKIHDIDLSSEDVRKHGLNLRIMVCKQYQFDVDTFSAFFGDSQDMKSILTLFPLGEGQSDPQHYISAYKTKTAYT